jgi:hypothetical protein
VTAKNAAAGIMASAQASFARTPARPPARVWHRVAAASSPSPPAPRPPHPTEPHRTPPHPTAPHRTLPHPPHPTAPTPTPPFDGRRSARASYSPGSRPRRRRRPPSRQQRPTWLTLSRRQPLTLTPHPLPPTHPLALHPSTPTPKLPSPHPLNPSPPTPPPPHPHPNLSLTPRTGQGARGCRQGLRGDACGSGPRRAVGGEGAARETPTRPPVNLTSCQPALPPTRAPPEPELYSTELATLSPPP